MKSKALTPLHQAIISYIRDTDLELGLHFDSYTEHEIFYLMFFPGRGLRLTEFGLQVMQRHFESCRICVPDDELHQPSHLVFLGATAKMPYYCGDVYLIVFDHQLALELSLVDGRLSTMANIS